MTRTADSADDSHSEQAHPIPADAPRLSRADVRGDAAATARRLLGVLLVRDDGTGQLVSRIVETEAYAGPDDQASHARAGRTARTAIMFGAAGHAYVYLVYGMHNCLNVVCGADGEAAAVLIRAVEPLRGLERMRARRGTAAGIDTRLAAGPARTCQALGIDRSLDGIDLLTDERLWLARDASATITSEAIISGPRIGVDYAGPEWAARPWRFGLRESLALSQPFRGEH